MDNKMRLHKIALGERTEETVRIYFEKAKQPEIKAMLPQKDQTVEEALADYRDKEIDEWGKR